MDDISFVPAAAACVLTALLLWWAIGRCRQSWAQKISAAVGGVVFGYVVYFVLAMILAIVLAALHPDPDRARQTGAALGHGFSTLPHMLMITAIIVLSLRGRSRAK